MEMGEEKWFGSFAKEIPGLDGDGLIVSLAANVVHEKNALKLLRRGENKIVVLESANTI